MKSHRTITAKSDLVE